MKAIEQEREQLLAQWTRIATKLPCWLSSPPRPVEKVLARDTSANDRRSAIRQVHDKLGFCAKGELRKGGLCAGTIFRTAAFINLSQESRSGARSTQTVHIEHTVPVNVLACELESRLGERPDAGLAWLFKHSVTTAMRKGQDRAYLQGVTRTTAAFDFGAIDEGKPFKRYSALFGAGEQVWDVWNRKEVDPDELTFEDHFETVLSVLREAGADRSFVQRMEATA